MTPVGATQQPNKEKTSPAMQTKTNQVSSVKSTVVAMSWLFLMSAGFVQAQIQDRPKAGPEQKQLEVWVGEWKYEGLLSETPLGPGGKFAGKSTSRMILDGLFLEGRGEDKGVYGGKELVYKGVNIQWYDPKTKTYLSQHFDNDGVVGGGVTTVAGNTWTTTGNQTDSKGKTYKTRSSATVSADGKTITEKAELSADDGKTWVPYWEDTLKKVGK